MVAANGTSFMSIPLITLQTHAAFGSLIPYRLSPNPKFRNVALGSFIEGDSHPTTVPPRPEVHECIWGDTFLSSYPPEDFKPSAAVEERINELKKQVVSMLHIGSSQTCLKKITSLINNIQRLGLAYHFESELENLLKIINDDTNHHYYDLHDVALRFRLLRQDGYYVSSDVFDQFKSSEGGFNPNLCADVKGLLSLYEAAYLGIHGEDILTEAIAFTMKYLKLLLTQQPRHPLARVVRYALELPIRMRIQQTDSMMYISMYEEDDSAIKSLLELAKLNFNVLQLLYRSELDPILRWWKKVDLVRKLPFGMRNRLVECYVMALNCIPDPKYSFGRVSLTKLWILMVAIDDFCDVYKKVDEIQVLNEAISRWDMGPVDEMPEYIKIYLFELFKIFDEIDMEMIKRGAPYAITYLRQEMKNYVQYLLDDTKLLKTGHIPPLEEWLEHSKVTVGYYVSLMVTILDVSEHMSEEVLDWASKWPKILTASSIIGRLIDDYSTFKTEQERGNYPSSVTCYMKEYGVSESEAIENIFQMIDDHWKIMNKECMRPTPVHMKFLTFSLEMARVMHGYYLHGDELTESRSFIKEIITSLIINPVPI